MNVLLDTHALLWWAKGDQLRQEAAAIIAEPSNEVFVSATSTWEIAIKSALGKLSVSDELYDLIDQDFRPLPLSLEDGRAAGSLPLHHRDPFDRMLIAQALAADLPILTRDRNFAQYGVTVIEA